MKKLILVVTVLGVVGLFSFLPHGACTEYYTVTLQRIDQDLYKDINSGRYIQTRYCYEYVYVEEAFLKDDGPFQKKLIFRNDQTCDVLKVF